MVSLAGELDIAAGEEVEAALAFAVEFGAPRTVIDLSRVTFIDAYVLGLITRARRSAINRGAVLGVSGVEGRIAELFAVLRLGDLVLTALDARA